MTTTKTSRPTIAAFDPGTTTGIACLHDGVFWSSQFDIEDTYRWLDIHGLEISFAQVEKFTITAATTKKTIVYDSLYLIGVILNKGWQYGFDIGFTKPADVMASFTDEALKRVGWHTPGKGHANDAARHLAWYAVRNGLMSGRVFLP